MSVSIDDAEVQAVLRFELVTRRSSRLVHFLAIGPRGGKRSFFCDRKRQSSFPKRIPVFRIDCPACLDAAAFSTLTLAREIGIVGKDDSLTWRDALLVADWADERGKTRDFEIARLAASALIF